MSKKTVFAIAAHPDDIEFMMGGTLFLLKEAGCDIHYMNIANGDCGTERHDKKTIASIRREEAIEATRLLGAHFHESLCPDLEVFYDKQTLARVISVVREVKPDIVLTLYHNDYMEDHTNASRLAVSATFCRGMLNAPVEPAMGIYSGKATVYHAMPYGLHDPMRNLVKPEFFVDITTTLTDKREMLAAHKSQKEWLDVSQGMDSYLIEMELQSERCGKLSGKFEYAEGWSRHLHLGLCGENDNPLMDLLSGNTTISE